MKKRILFILILMVFPLALSRVVFADSPISCDASNPGQVCGFIGGYAPGDSGVSKCSLDGKSDSGGGYCSSDGSDGGPGDWAVVGAQQATVPTQDNSGFPYYTAYFFNNMAVSVSILKVANGGSASVGTASASNMSCGCGPNDVNPPDGNDSACTAASAFASGAANPGDALSFTAVDMCKPNSNNDLQSSCSGTSCGQWATGQATMDFPQTTYCYTAAGLAAGGWNGTPGSYQNVTDYTATSFGVCAPASVPQGTIVVNSVDTNSNPVSASWTLSGPATISGSGNTGTNSNEPIGNYTLTAGTAPTGYTYVGISPASSQTLADQGTVTFTITWKKAVVITPPTCSPSASTVVVGSPVTFTYSGGSGSGYEWSIPGGSETSGSTQGISETFSTPGTQNATITDGSEKSGSCSVTVTPQVSTGSGVISASPSPCTIAAGGMSCTTTITWSTQGYPANKVYVVASTPGGRVNPNNWIGTGTGSSVLTNLTATGGTFDLDICSGGTCPTTLATVTVYTTSTPVAIVTNTPSDHWSCTARNPDGTMANYGPYCVDSSGNYLSYVNQHCDMSTRPTSCPGLQGTTPQGAISANPNPCTIASGASECASTITWSSSNVPTGDGVYLVAYSIGTTPSLSNAALSSANGSQSVPWISAHGYTIDLDVCSGSGYSLTCPTKLATVNVYGQNAPTYSWSCNNSNQDICTDSNSSTVPNADCSGTAPDCIIATYGWSCNGTTASCYATEVNGVKLPSPGTLLPTNENNYCTGAVPSCVNNSTSTPSSTPSSTLPLGGGNPTSTATSTQPQTPTYSCECVFGSNECVDTVDGSDGGNSCGVTCDVCVPPVTISVSPSSANVNSGATQQFSAVLKNVGSDTGIVWSVTAGTITSSGLFTAPNVTSTTPQTVTITAVPHADNSVSANATASIFSSAQCTLTANPQNILLGTKSQLQWGCQSAVSCTINGQSVSATGGTLTVSPAKTTQYVLSCANSQNVASEAATTVGVSANPGIQETNP